VDEGSPSASVSVVVVDDDPTFRDLARRVRAFARGLVGAGNERLRDRVAKVLAIPTPDRDPVRDQLARSTLLALSSDWAFMVTKDSAAGYARDRHERHHREARHLADLVERGDDSAAHALALRLHDVDGPFGHLDARLLPTGG